MLTEKFLSSGRSPVILGLMSGTSLDGLDMAFCTFDQHDGRFSFQILAAETVDYDEVTRKMLSQAPQMTAVELVRSDRHYGRFLGEAVRAMVERHRIVPDVVASHGHTIFHVPSERFTLQLGHGPSISAACGLPVFYDFRSMDVALGGQGAPLVPIGDRALFADYQACVNLGGFSNVSFEQHGERVAFDICPVNFVANWLAQREHRSFDLDGAMGSGGVVIPALLQSLQSLAYHRVLPPKSLGREWVEADVFPLFSRYATAPTGDLLRTLYEYIARQIVSDIPFSSGRVLFTGGGAKNKFLMQLIQNQALWKVVIPDETIIDYKEAMIFAFMAYLNFCGVPNCLSSVTGAVKDSMGGSLVLNGGNF